MNKLILFFCFLSAFNYIAAQADLKVVATTGGSFESTDLQVSWTLGEAVIATLETPGIVLTQGFHQPVYDLVAVHPIADDQGSVTIYPNPFTETINLELHFKQTEKGMVRMTDLSGKLWRSLPFDAKEITLSCNTSDLPCGEYLITTSGLTFSSTSSIVKIQ